jgi:glutathione-regulated potassium-efflux system ancillary protein KefC
LSLDLHSTAFVAAVVVLTGLVSIKTGLPFAVLETLAGVLLGSFLGLTLEPWLDFLGTMGGLALTFLAGAEISLKLLGLSARQSIILGAVGFISTLLGEMVFLSIFTGWSFLARMTASLALTATAVVVVYTLLLMFGLLEVAECKMIVAATFVTDFLALSSINLVFHEFNLYTLAFVAIVVLIMVGLPRMMDYLVKRYGHRAVEMELRFIFAILLAVSFLADLAKLQAVYGAFILGLVFANTISSYADVVPKLRSVTFSLLSPAFFIKACLLVSLPAVVQSLGLILSLLGIKLLSKFLGLYHLNKRWSPGAPLFATLLLSTGLTVGTITVQLGRDLGVLDLNQFSVVLITIILGAIIPAALAKSSWVRADLENISAAGTQIRNI